MSASLIETLGGLMTPSILGKISSSIGESEAATSKAVGAAFPAVLAGLLGRTSDQGAMGMLEGLLRDKVNDGSALSNIGGLLGGGNSPMQQLGTRFLSAVFGNQLGPIAGALAQLSGIKTASASSLLSLAGPIVMGLLGSKMREGGGGLASLLNSQRQSILGAVPPGISSLLGALPAVSMPSLPREEDRRSGGMGWLLPVLGALVLGVLGWSLLG